MNAEVEKLTKATGNDPSKELNEQKVWSIFGEKVSDIPQTSGVEHVLFSLFLVGGVNSLSLSSVSSYRRSPFRLLISERM